MRGKNLTFESRPTDFKKDDVSFKVFEAAYKKVAKKQLSLKEYISLGMCRPDGILTFAGLLFVNRNEKAYQFLGFYNLEAYHPEA